MHHIPSELAIIHDELENAHHTFLENLLAMKSSVVHSERWSSMPSESKRKVY